MMPLPRVASNQISGRAEAKVPLETEEKNAPGQSKSLAEASVARTSLEWNEPRRSIDNLTGAAGENRRFMAEVT